jgi:hypothetical protein
MSGNIAAWLFLVSVLSGLSAIQSWWKILRARDWPETRADVVSAPESPSERWFRHIISRWNTDSDYCLEWTVDGGTYRRRLENESEVSVAGFVLWSKAPDRTPRRIRFNPRNPSKSFLPDEAKNWIVPTGIGVACLVAGLVVNAV